MSIFDNLKGRTIMYGKLITDEIGQMTFIEDDELIHVVRCKECVWYDGKFCVNNEIYTGSISRGITCEDWFCADGERREKE